MDKKRFKIISIIIPFVFYIGMAIIDGTVWCVDSASYTSMDFSREPVYPLFLLGIRKLFELFDFAGTMYGQPSYLFCVVIIQSLLWVYTAARLGIYMYDYTLEQRYSRQRATIVGLMGLFSQMAVAILNRFVANRGSMYSECIMTEALAMPLFVLFSIRLFELFRNYSAMNMLAVFLLSVLISSIRKQMLITILVMGAVSLIIHLIVKRTRDPRRFLSIVIMGILAVISIGVIDRGYNLAVRGKFAEHVGNSKGTLCTVLYTADAEDVHIYDKYEDSQEFPELGSLYTRIYNECVAKELTISYAPSQNFDSTWLEMTSHYAEGYDIIGFDIVIPYCQQYVSEKFPELSGPEFDIKENEVEAVLAKELLLKDIKGIFTGKSSEFLYVLVANVAKALVISVANNRPAILVKVSIFIYLFYLILFSVRLIMKKDEKSRELCLFALIVFMGILINSVVTGSMIFPQPRYMCYGMGLFYLTIGCGILYQ